MPISVDLKALTATYVDNKSVFKHKTGEKIWLFPFVTNDKSAKNEIACELKDFRGISGEALRLHTSQELPPRFGQEMIIDNASEKVTTSEKAAFKKIIKQVCFGDSDNIYRFSKKSLLYQQVQNSQKTLNSFAEYIVEVFLENKELDFEENDSEVVLYKLLNAAMPKLKKVPVKRNNNCYLGLGKIRELFANDLAILQKDNHLFINNFDKLLKYYLYFYLTQLVFKLKNKFSAQSEHSALFYSVDWEPLSESREAYTYGLKLIQEQVKEIFPHVVCLELLHHIEGIGERKFVYSELKERINSFSDEEKSDLLQAVKVIYKFYVESLKDVNWDLFERQYKSSGDTTLLEAVNKLHQAIYFQFSITSRGRASEGYGKWILEFGRQNFGKRRGRLGYTHALTQDYILLFIKLCVGSSSEEKIRLSGLWEQLECRGIHFDLFSKQEIITFLDKNNMLEKKSDSGDAQYVTVQG